MSRPKVIAVSLALQRAQDKAKKEALAKAVEQLDKIKKARRPSHEPSRTVDQCLISLSVTKDTKDNKKVLGDLEQVPINDNEILNQLLKGLPPKPQKDDKYTILVDGSRYGMEIFLDDYQKTAFFQHFLHYDGQKLVSVNYRQVLIYWKLT